MRGPDGRLIADLNDQLPAIMSGSIYSALTSSLNENLTEYVLLPELINDPPYISQSIFRTSQPNVKPIQFNEPGLQTLFIDEQGVVKVLVGTSFKLRVRASQPPIYNVENGRPTLIVDQAPLPPPPVPGIQVTTGSVESSLIYAWQKDGDDFIRDTDPERVGSSVYVSGTDLNELTFINVSPKFAGTYLCEASNDIGSVESEQITLEVYNPDIDDYFYNNLVNNPYGKDGLDQWLTPDQEFITARLSNTEFKNLSQPWNRDAFGYTVDMMYPRPYHINTYHVKNSNLTNDILQDGYYFTREKFKYKAKGGKAVVNAEYDVELGEIRDYIQGGIYGIDGVRAVFGAYLGNAISAYKYTILSALADFRSSKAIVDVTQPRASLANSLLAGVPTLSETVVVTITEYDNETPLISQILDVSNNSTITSAGYAVYDPWYTRLEQANSQNIQLIQSGPNATLGNTKEEKILWVVDNLMDYPAKSYIPTFAQYAEWNKVVIDKLDFRTNKIRISVHFFINNDVLNDTTGKLLDESEDCFEFNTWELLAQAGKFPQRYPQDFFSASINNQPPQLISVYELNRLNYGNNEPIKNYVPVLGNSRALVTGVNLVLIPLESTQPSKIDYYTKTILEPNVNPTVYSAVDAGVGPMGPALLPNYETNYIGVHLMNVWRLPHRIYDTLDTGAPLFSDNLSSIHHAAPEISSLTSVSTFKYAPLSLSGTGQGNQSNTFNISDDYRGNWQYTALDDMIDAIDSGSVEVIYYKGARADITKGALPDLKGILRSGILSFVGDGLINTIPTNYTRSFVSNIQDFKRNLGFYFDFEVKKHGYPTTATDSASLFMAWKLPDPYWAAPKISHKHNLLQNIAYDYVLATSQTQTQPQSQNTASIVATGYWNISWDQGGYEDQIYYNSINQYVLANGQFNADLITLNTTYTVDNNQLTSVYGEDVLHKTSSFVSFKLQDYHKEDDHYVVGLEGWEADPNGGTEPTEYYYWRIFPHRIHYHSLAGNFYTQQERFNRPEATIAYSGSDGFDIYSEYGHGGPSGTRGAIGLFDQFVSDPNHPYDGYPFYKGWTYDLDTTFAVSATATQVSFWINNTIVHTTPRQIQIPLQQSQPDLKFSARRCLYPPFQGYSPRSVPLNNNPNNLSTVEVRPGLKEVKFGPYNPALTMQNQLTYSLIRDGVLGFGYPVSVQSYPLMYEEAYMSDIVAISY